MAVLGRLAPLTLLVLLVLAGTARAQPATPVMQPPTTIDGPNSAIQGLSGLSVSRDGTGGLVYLESVNGVDHVFVSVLTGGAFGAPAEIDGGLPGASSRPVIAAGDGGLLLIAFTNGNQLFVVSRQTSSAAFSAPQDLYNGAMNPSIELSIHSEGYLAFTAIDGSGFDVRDLYYQGGQWQLASAPLNVAQADNAGTGAGAPKVAAAGDGEAIVAWGENGHIYARRVWYGMTSYVVAQADVPSLQGFSEVGADAPVIAVGDNSSYSDVAFRETFSNGSQTISRVLVNRMVGSAFQGVVQADGQSFAGGPGAMAPGISMMQYGTGFVTSELQGPDQVWATLLGQNGAPRAAQQIDSLPNASAPYPTSAIAGDYTGLIAWQHDPGLLGSPDVRVRFYSNATFGPELLASNPALGPTNAAEGLFAAGDHGGDVAIAYVQGTGSSTTIQVAQLVYPPGSFGIVSASSRYLTTTTPALMWTAPRELWGVTSYAVTIDGVAAGSTYGTTSFRPTVPLAQGPHSFAVAAVNAHGLTSSASPRSFFVDSLPPVGQLTLRGAEHVNATLRLRVSYTDTQTGVPPADTSGVATVMVNWGDGTSNRIHVTTATHRYLRAGRYTMKITIIDRAGNQTVLSKQIRITTKPAGHAGPKKKKKK
ncbi:MAG: PKD domain-containing protein [Actinomycetota bacterium]|nr:PKD domain-containing protein [Actinomycetota bacterium]